MEFTLLSPMDKLLTLIHIFIKFGVLSVSTLKILPDIIMALKLVTIDFHIRLTRI